MPWRSCSVAPAAPTVSQKCATVCSADAAGRELPNACMANPETRAASMSALNAASAADYQVGGERPHLRRTRLSELERGNGQRIAGQDARGDLPGADRSLPALPGGRLCVLVAQHPQRRSAAVSLQEAAGGGIERALSEDHLHWREAVRLATWAPLSPETGLQLVKERVRMVGHGAEEEGRFRQ